MKRMKIDLEGSLREIKPASLMMKKVSGENLDLDYTVLLSTRVADELFQRLEDELEYYEGDFTKVKVFGKWHPIPRQQVAHGDDKTHYHFSGNTIPAKPWTPLLTSVKELLKNITGFEYNFVLINRYKDGNDHIGEHRDDEKELCPNTPIASLSLGQQRVFVLKHRDSRKSGYNSKRKIPTTKLELQHGSLLLMNPPTNEYWYHSLPVRKKALGARINLTFRKIKVGK